MGPDVYGGPPRGTPAADPYGTSYRRLDAQALFAFVAVPGAIARTVQLPPDAKVTRRRARPSASGVTVHAWPATHAVPTSRSRR